MRRGRLHGQGRNQHVHLIQSTGVLSAASREGGLSNWGRPRTGGGRSSNIVRRMMARLGVGEGQMYRRSRVTPAEGRALTLEELLKKKRTGDGQTFKAIESQGLLEWLEGIRKDLHDKAYKPQPMRRVVIPKPGGGERPLGILNSLLRESVIVLPTRPSRTRIRHAGPQVPGSASAFPPR